MRGKQAAFFISIVFALIWLAISISFAMPWVRDVSKKIPALYAAWVIGGIALLPGYLMSGMFVSNLLNMQPSGAGDSVDENVTVLICARNEQESIYETIKRVVDQSYPGKLTILCVDNGSADETRSEMDRAIACLQSPTRMIRALCCNSPGKAHALNAGLSLIETRFFVTVDADTFLERTAIDIIVKRIASTHAGCVAGNVLVKKADTWIQKMQIYDYLISIAAVKRYQGSYGTTLVAQGAFSAYDTQAVMDTGGWTQCAGEDIVLTYRLLGQGRLSLYEAGAVGYTLVPQTLRALCRQRIRWARGMFEGFGAVPPWRQPSFFTGYFETINLSIVYLDLAYVFGFWVGVFLMLFGINWFVGWRTVLMLPAVIISSASVYLFQKRLPAVTIENSAVGGLLFVLLFQTIQSVCSLVGYAQATRRKRLKWK